MSAKKGIHLWLRRARKGHKATWIIKDGEHQKSTRCGLLELEQANRALAAYIASKHKPEESRGRPLSEIPVADVIALYQQDISDQRSRPKANRSRLKRLLDFFGLETLADISKRRCAAYVKHRKSEQAARRELEDLRAAINHFFSEETVPPVVNIHLPPKAEARRRWLTEAEAAKLLRAAWRKTQPMPKGGRRHVGRHLARFILVGLYTGSRSGAICGAAIRPTEGRGYVDLDNAVFYRRAPGTRDSTKRQPPARLPEKLLVHLRRWARLGLCQHSIIEWEGQPVKRISKAFKALTRDLGFHDVTPHTLRHTGISWALQRGAKPWDVADYFGVSEKVIQATYGHHDPEHQQEVTRRMDRKRPVAERRSGIAPVAEPVAASKSPRIEFDNLAT